MLREVMGRGRRGLRMACWLSRGLGEEGAKGSPRKKKDELTGSWRLEARGLQRRRVSEKSKTAPNERGRERQTERLRL